MKNAMHFQHKNMEIIGQVGKKVCIGAYTKQVVKAYWQSKYMFLNVVHRFFLF